MAEADNAMGHSSFHSTVLAKLFAKYPESFGFSVSHTTRQPRPGETPGKSYHYIERAEFETMSSEGKFVEWAEFSGNLYGTSFDAVNSVKETGKICVLDLEIKGVKSIKASDMDAKYLFIQPPSLEILEARLRGRNTETEETLQKRLATAKEAMDYAEDESKPYDIVIVNDKVEEAYQQLEKFILENWEITEEPTVLAQPSSVSGEAATTSGSPTDTITPPGPQAPSTTGPTMTIDKDILPIERSPDAPPANIMQGETAGANAVPETDKSKGKEEDDKKGEEKKEDKGKGPEGGKTGDAVPKTEEAKTEEGAAVPAGGEAEGAGDKNDKKKKKSKVCNIL
ncbi:hypothetical protein HK104_009886 [Borealophlyctis nickersoniae]|nr:hypothetical protein HK104_009886 [Borealophlyctis nickersoniae]